MAIELNNISSGYNLSAINDNFQKLEDVLNNNVLWRTGSVAGETLMSRDIDMNGHTLLNLASDPSNPGSILTIAVADARYYNVSGDKLEGDMDAGGNRITNLPVAVSQTDAVRKKELDSEIGSRQAADANLQEQLTGNVPLEASNFSEISWHNRRIDNSVTIPENKNAWSFGPQMEIAEGQLVTIGVGSTWTIADGRVVEDEDLHNLIADTIRTPDGSATVNINDVATNTALTTLTNRVTAEENKVNVIALGGTGATTAAAARTNLGAAASGANTDITSIVGSAATLTTPRTVQTNLASTTATAFDGSANISPGVTGILPIANGGTGNATGLAASATQLATSRTLQTNLASTTATGFNGTSNITMGVTGTLAVSNGGTGATTVAAARTSLAITGTVCVHNARATLASSTTGVFAGDGAVVGVSATGLKAELGAFSATLNLASVGVANGVSASVASSAFLAVYVIYNGSTTALYGIDASSVKAPMFAAPLPSGYTYSVLLTVVPLASGSFKESAVISRNVYIPSTDILTGAAAAGPALSSVSASTAIPINAITAMGYVDAVSTVNTDSIASVIAATASGVGQSAGYALGILRYVINNVPVITAQTLYASGYRVSGTGTVTRSISITGYSI